MITVRRRAILPFPVERVWQVVANPGEASWRSDLSRVEVHDAARFTEYTLSGFPTTFTVTARESCRRWEFDLENANLRGHWTGEFNHMGTRTEVVFTEAVHAHAPLPRLLIRLYLRRQQVRYLRDLRRALSCTE